MDFFERADAYVALLEEPFHSPSLVTNQHLWRAMAREGVRVSINGAAGDELLAGYANEYAMPYLRHLIATGQFSRFFREFRLAGRDQAFPIDLPRKLNHLLPEALRLSGRAPLPAALDPYRAAASPASPAGPADDFLGRLEDLMTQWRMNYWMRAGNKSALGVPIEVRMPFLDHRVVEFAFSLPPTYLIRDGWHKWILRQALADRLPHEVVWAPTKRGFPFPLETWLPAARARFLAVLADLDCPYLDSGRLSRGYLDLARLHPPYLWRLLSLGLWWKRCVLGQPLFTA